MRKITIILFLCVSWLFATVSATVSQDSVVRGDEVTLNLSATGDDIKFPPINDIAGYKIDSSEQSQSITIINGHTTKTLTNSYTFTPLKSVTIPSYEIEVDGKMEKTKPIVVKVLSQTAVGVNPSFTLSMIADKDEAYVGEPITLKIVFRQKRDERVEGIRFAQPKFPGFWVKTDGKDRKEVVGNYIIHNLTYILIPQQSGVLKIPAVKVSIAKMAHIRDAFSFMIQRLRWKNVYSNELSIKVKPLPPGVHIFGSFKISAKVDKKEVKVNEPVNLTLTLTGSGNIDDINDFKISIPSATVYSNKAKRDTYLEGNEYKGVLKQKFAIISDKSFTIPSIKFRYFDKVSKKVKTIKTKPIDIKVIGAKNSTPSPLIEKKVLKQPKTIVKTKIVYKSKNSFEKWIYFIVGFFLCFFIAVLKEMLKRKKSDATQHPLSWEIKSAKDDKELLKILLPYVSKSDTIKNIVDQLEENIYLNKNHKIDKKSLSKNIQSYIEPKNEDDDL